VLVVWLKLK